MARITREDVPKSKHFCILPWTHFQLSETGKLHPCCRTDRRHSYGSIRHASPEEIWNQAEARNLRREMLADRASPLCTVCYKVEAAGGLSFRKAANRMFADRFELVETTAEDGSVPAMDVRSLELRLSNLCNFRCRTCDPFSSTAWYADGRKLEMPIPPFHESETECEREDFLDALEPILPRIQRLYFAGGEPLLHEAHYRILERLLELGRDDVALDYNTNLSTLVFRDWDVLTLWRQFRSVSVGASLDGTGPQAELLRKGTNWGKIVDNFERLRRESAAIYPYIHATASAMNLFHLPVAIDDWIQRDWIQWPDQLRMNLLQTPRQLHPNVLTAEEKAEVRALYRGFLANLKPRASAAAHVAAERALTLVSDSLGTEFWPEERSAFQRYMRALDELRAENFAALFPEFLRTGDAIHP